MYNNRPKTGVRIEYVRNDDECRCDGVGYCPVHGEYHPAIARDKDGEALPTLHRTTRED